MLLTFSRKIEVTASGLTELRLIYSNAELFNVLWNVGQPYFPSRAGWLPSLSKAQVLFVTVLNNDNEYSVIRREWWIYYSWSAALTIEVIT